jgi:transcriptional regulator with XRE-family HTH domain
VASKAEWFPGRLRELREAAGLTQTQLAERVGVQRDAVARWEAGNREPLWSNVVALAESLGVSTEAFLQPPTPRAPAGPGRPARATVEPPTREPARPRRRQGSRGTRSPA